MVIGIDGNEANVAQRVGVSVYTTALLSYFQKNASKNLQFRVFLRQAPLEGLPPQNKYFTYRVVPSSFLWSQLFLPAALFAEKDLAVFWSPAHYAPRFVAVPTVVTIHDLAYFHYPQEFLKRDLYKLVNWTGYSVRKAKKVISVSHNTKRDLISRYKVPEEKIKVIHNGFSTPKGRLKELGFKLKDKKYILYVGTLQPRKNIPSLISAFEKFKLKFPEYKLVIAGKKGWLYNEIFHKVKSRMLEDSVIFKGFVSDEEKVYLYRHALCFVLPSYYEGFGIPVLEAMANDCPVVCSNTSSLPEVGGDAALFFDPEKPQELTSHLELLAKDKKAVAQLIKKGRARTKLFSWDKCASQTLAVLKEAAL